MLPTPFNPALPKIIMRVKIFLMIYQIQILFKILGFLGYPYDMTGEFIRIKNVVSNNKIACHIIRIT